MADYNGAAKAIIKADFLILAIGAGFSADSGLAVYKDIATVPAYIARGLTYQGICQPDWICDDPELFYGFWGKCFNDYRQAIPHKGYEIVNKWKQQFFSTQSHAYKELHETLDHKRSLKEPEELPGPFFIYSSNVDALPIKAGFSAHELYEIHGNTETWQCSVPCRERLWSAPKDFSFKVDLNTMLAAETNPNADYTKNNGFISNHPKCIFCGARARPSILMFGDGKWVQEDTHVWYDWKKSVLQILEMHKEMSAVVVEVGCGDNVPSVRHMSERFLDSSPSQVTLIRINLDSIETTWTENTQKVIGIKERGLIALTTLDAEIERIQQELMNDDEKNIEIAADGADISDLIAAVKDITMKDYTEEEEETKSVETKGKEDC